MRSSPFLALMLMSGLVSACGELDQEGMVLLLDEEMSAEIVLGNGDGIASPDGLLWSGGTLYIADEGGSAVRAWTPGRPVRTLADRRDGLSSPEDLAADSAGNLYASDDDRGGVWQISSRRAVASLPSVRAASSSEGLALSPQGLLLVGDQRGHRILAAQREARGFVLLNSRGGIRKPESFSFDDDGDLYVADNLDRVLYRLARDGTLHRPIAGRPGFSPESIHFTDSGLYITDSEHGKLFRYTEQDGLVAVAVFAGTLSNVQGITSDEAGNLFVSVQSDLDDRKGYVLRLNRQPPG
jgi:serine/threonine-protein kinase